jgi:hypothetical protein
MEQMLSTAERKAEAIDEAQRCEFGETAAEREERVREEAKFSQEAFLQKDVVQGRSAVGAELDEGQADKHQEGEGDEADSGGDGDSSISHDS